MDSPFYTDLRPPFNIVAPAAVTLASTDKALHLAAHIGNLGQQNWFPGKTYRIHASGKFTSAATPGNFSMALYWGTGADANGTVLAQGAAVAWTANQTDMTWHAWFEITILTLGATGTVQALGQFRCNESAIAAELQIPATAPAAVTIDTTAASNVFSVQAKRSGSTAETMQMSAGYPKVFALN